VTAIFIKQQDIKNSDFLNPSQRPFGQKEQRKQHVKTELKETTSGYVNWIELSSLLECYTVLTGEHFLTYQRSPIPPSPGSSSTACFLDYSTLKMKGIHSSVQLVTVYQSTQCNITEDLNLQQHCHEKF
jgi:hypothetical protein